MKHSSVIVPRLIRFRDAPRYLGMDRNRFNAEVRPCLTEIRIGKQGIAFDRLELDAWVDQYISRNGCPAEPGGEISWQRKRHPASFDEAESGTSTKRSADAEFRAALAHAASTKRKWS
jgi:hypothetical protein